MNTRFARLALALLASLAASCSRTHAPASASVMAAQGGGETLALTHQPSILARMYTAPGTVRHGGLRRLRFQYEIAGATQLLTYEERVTADGNGHFALDPVRVGQPAMTEAQAEVFELTQKGREGFFFRYRDFGVRHRQLFDANYRVVDLGSNPLVAGRACREFEVERIAGATVKYRLAVDVETALVLRSIELQGGVEVARAEFVDFTLQPATNDVAWFDAQFEGRTFDSNSAAASHLGFTPVAPRYLPAGYQHMHSEILDVSGEAWVRRTYGDGVESLLLLHKAAHGGGSDATWTDGKPLSRNPTTADALATPPAPIGPVTYKIRVLNAGPWTVAEVLRGEEQIFVVGKMGEDAVLRVLESTL